MTAATSPRKNQSRQGSSAVGRRRAGARVFERGSDGPYRSRRNAYFARCGRFQPHPLELRESFPAAAEEGMRK